MQPGYEVSLGTMMPLDHAERTVHKVLGERRVRVSCRPTMGDGRATTIGADP